MNHTSTLTPFGLLGKTLGHSYSPQIHKALGNPDYVLYERAPHELTEFLGQSELKGLNVTIPYKKDVMSACHTLSDAAKHIGAVNTMVRQADNTWYGHNTDYDGFIYMLERAGISIKGQKVVILGDGATAHTIHVALTDLEAKEIIHLSRKTAPFYSEAKHYGADADVLINATPVGTFPNCPDSLISLDDFPKLKGVADVIYNPYRTALLIEAEKRGIPYTDGLPMLVGQAVAAAKLFMQKDFPPEATENIIRQMRHAQENIILIGMPGVGKTTIATALAKRLQRPLIDCDDVFEERYCHPGEYIKTYGEPAFREKETALLAELCKTTGAIIATGGGVVTQPVNFPILRQNGRIYWLRRPLEKLAIDGRPLSQGGLGRLESLYTVREPLYEAFSQCSFDIHDPDTGAAQIEEEYHAHFNS
ncbi:MAG: AAA family ATPase [Veillonella sp.]|nr:AAA family ATPase [Veillonella sp.]